jgi:hypothetical protein
MTSPPQLSLHVGATHGRFSNKVPQDAMIVAGGLLVNTGGVRSAVTVNEALHDLGPSQLLVTVQVTVIVPPQELGACGVTGLVVTTLLHPPPLCTEASHAANLVLIAACVWHASSVLLPGHVNVTTGAAVTVNDALHVLGASQLLVTVQVTLVTPPQAFGACGVTGLVVTTLLHPPPDWKVASHAANLVLIEACV